MKQEKQEEFGIIEFPKSAFSCTVHDRTATLAVLELPSSADIPDAFELFIDRKRFRCRALWRDEQRLGVKFV
ncbi:PilZ domain-containing protein [Bradyrhizobium sp. CCGB01]|uniref:PilZ domain-containing protein n=2 Tax=unclassified Bradyrhizobium TaxID=2631580 RepID=UPI0020B40D6B|nr:PilZ domain-containing protein [Bradyrhizobium sp. CCGB01]MCP3406409.1 PilZ domain-containing protein [Bradyrhizobium sp. CCGB01]